MLAEIAADADNNPDNCRNGAAFVCWMSNLLSLTGLILKVILRFLNYMIFADFSQALS